MNDGGMLMVVSPRRTARALPPAEAAPDRHRVHKIALASAAVLLVTVVVAVLTQIGRSPASAETHTPEIRARTYSSIADCLLTGPDGIQSTTAAAVWAGMQAASTSSRAQVSYLSMLGADTLANAQAYINTLVLRGCNVILAVGTAPVRAANEQAAVWPHQRLIAITAGTSPTAATAAQSGNLTVLPASNPQTLQGQIRALLTVAGSSAQPTA